MIRKKLIFTNGSRPCGKRIRQKLVHEGVGLPRRRFIPGGDPRYICPLVGKGMQNPGEQDHLPFRAGCIHFRFKGIPIHFWGDRVRRAVSHEERGFDRPFPRLERRFQIAVNGDRRGNVGTVARQLQNVAATETKPDRRAPLVD
jgi:hypothetical protein